MFERFRVECSDFERGVQVCRLCGWNRIAGVEEMTCGVGFGRHRLFGRAFDILLRWVQEKLCPTFKKLYPGKKMILITDNTPYHHTREIGSI